MCGHDATGTNVELTCREGRVARVTGRPDPNYAVEEGWLSDLSRFAFTGNDAPDRLRGRVLALYLFAFNGAVPLGGLLTGWLCEVGGTQLALLVGGVASVAMTVLALARRPVPAAATA